MWLLAILEQHNDWLHSLWMIQTSTQVANTLEVVSFTQKLPRHNKSAGNSNIEGFFQKKNKQQQKKKTCCYGFLYIKVMFFVTTKI